MSRAKTLMVTFSQAVVGGLLASVLLFPSAALPGDAAHYLRAMEGTWAGTGTLQISQASKNTKIRCKIVSTFDEDRRTLRNKGKCATTQRRTVVSGSISYNETGSKLSGAFINSFGDYKMTRSSGSIRGRTLTLSTTSIDETTGKVLYLRNVIRKMSARKYSVTLYQKIDGTYQKRGKMTFSRR